MGEKKSSNKGRERDSMNFEKEQQDLFNTPNTRSSGQPRNTGKPDDRDPDFKKSEHEMGEKKSSNKGGERDSMNFEKEQQDLFNTPNTRSSGQPRNTGKPDDRDPDFKKSEHEMRENKSSNKGGERNSMRQPHSTKGSAGNQGGDNPDSHDNDKKRITDEEFDLFLKTPISQHDQVKRSRKITNKKSDDEETDDEETDVDYDDSENDDCYNDLSSRNNSDKHTGRSNSQDNRVNPEQRNNFNERRDFGWAKSQEDNRVDPRQFREDPNPWERVGKNSGSYQGSSHEIPRYSKDPNLNTNSDEYRHNNSQGSRHMSIPGSFNNSNTYGPLTDNNGERESLYEGYRKKELQSNSNSGMINRFVSGVSAGVSGVLKFGGNKDDEEVDENIDEIRVIFHVHLPEVLNLKLTLNLPSG
ncbi:unnamed protein product [Rhizophagus irregularis]|nr:unnamed protein product [Rhizophagus irregularis]